MKGIKTLAVVTACLLAIGLAACSDDSSAGNNNTRPCNLNGECDSGEDCLWCQDCCVVCSLSDGDEYDYIMDELYIPTNATEARSIGVDIDGDGDIDNKLGQIMSLIPADEDPNVAIAENIAEGDIIILGRLVVDAGFPATDEAMAFQIFQGDTDSGDATEDNLTGTGSALIDPSADRSLHLCGTITGNYLEAGPSQITITMSLAGINLDITLDRAQAISEGTVDADGWEDVMIGGGISQDTMVTNLLPAIVDWLNGDIRDDPDGSVWEFVRDSVDCACDNTIEGCEQVVNQEGECVCWTPPDDPADPVSVTELMCNALLATALRPDVDIDGDQVPDLLSLGIRVSAISITIAN